MGNQSEFDHRHSAMMVKLVSILLFVLLGSHPTFTLETIMSYRDSMFLVRQGCPYRPHYYKDTNNLDHGTLQQYKECVKNSSPSEMSLQCSVHHIRFGSFIQTLIVPVFSDICSALCHKHRDMHRLTSCPDSAKMVTRWGYGR